jgi:hypothetical protein
MRFAEKEVECMEKQAVEEAEKDGRTLPPGEIVLPTFKELQAKKRAEAEKKFLEERALLEKNMSDIDKQILQIQKALRDIDGVQTIDSFFVKADKSEKNNCLDESKKSRLEDASKKRKAGDLDNGREGKSAGAVGPEGDFVEFPEYDGEEEPHESKRAFTLFCKRTRKEVKNSLSPSERKDKVRTFLAFHPALLYWPSVRTSFSHIFCYHSFLCAQDHVNGMLKDRWDALTENEKRVWKEWEVWDVKRYEHQLGIYEKKHGSPNSPKKAKNAEDRLAIPKKSSDINKAVLDRSASNSSGGFSIPKRRNS